MTTDPLANAYLKVLEEGVPSSEVKGTTVKPSDAPFGDKKNNLVKKISPKSATENADSEMEDVEEAPAELTSNGADGEAKKAKLQTSSFNPFDELYNKILNEEESFNFSTEDNSLQPDSSFDMNAEEDLEEFDDSEESEEDAEEVTITLSRDLAEKLHEVLMGVLGAEEGESEENEESSELDDLETETEEEVKEEAVEAEVVGHALVDQEKLNSGMTSPSNKEVKGAVPVTKKTAETPSTGKDSDGEAENCSPEPAIKKLQSKNNNTGGVTVGKTLFDNK